MARSKIKGTDGKPVAKTKKKSTKQASITIRETPYIPFVNRQNISIEARNDGDPHVYYSGPGQPERGVGRSKNAANPVKGKGPGAVKTSKASTVVGKHAKDNKELADDARKRAARSRKKRGDNL